MLALLSFGATCSPSLQAQTVVGETRAPKYSNEFLKIGVGARAAAMGNAMSATVSGAQGAYWNPAGMVQPNSTAAADQPTYWDEGGRADQGPKRHELALMHSERFAGVIKYDYGTFSTEIEPGRRLGLSVIRLGIDNIPNTLNFKEGNAFNYDKITKFSVADLGVFLSYSQIVKNVEGLSFGGNVKVINRVIGDFATAWGFGLDAGVQYRHKGLRLGLMAMDVTNTFNAWTYNTELLEDPFIATGNEIPQNSVEITLPSTHLGIGYSFDIIRQTITATLALENSFHFDGQRNVVANIGNRVSWDPHAGAEITYKDIVYLRGGVMKLQYIDDLEGEEKLNMFPTAGLGLQYKMFKLDYALSNLGNFQRKLYSHVISLRIAFNDINL